MDPTSHLRLSLGFVGMAINMLFGTNRGRKNLLSPGAIEILYTSYFSPVCMGDIAGMLGISPSSATDLVNYLEREGFVCRVQDPDNRRVIRVVPAEKGKIWLLETEEKIYGFLESHLSRLPENDRYLFADLCSRFTGVEDEMTFIAEISGFKKDRGNEKIPLVTYEDGKLLRLEEVVDRRYQTDPFPYSPKEMTVMFETRVPETVEGIQDEITVAAYDIMQRGLRDAGHLPVEDLVKQTQPGDKGLEIGPGPGYYGLEWVRKTEGTTLTGLEISPAMIRLASENTLSYNLNERVTYQEGNALMMPFEDNLFSLAFSNGSLHEWEDAGVVFSEIHRVLQPGGRVMVTDLKRDLSPEIFTFMQGSCRSEEIRKGFETSVRAAYKKEELEDILSGVSFRSSQVIAHPYGLVVLARK
ncbi:MAG: methyltransferase domain-containing protein [Methanospirillum sp.]|uniref:methyltransferase domain-containing protein n=1 Tax=Methanospirillum sp. TaxID=45200 RepID=UPI0023731B1B|nr:methyltransferase domain-containing protein [Methanospirillum sp.]MDD1729726.1 methyltransferase domain-containing protein [Methanospirillum sp.]